MIPSFDFVTTMFDLYGLPGNFPNQSRITPSMGAYNKARLLEEGLEQNISSTKFIPYIQLHEFEALLFSDVSRLTAHLGLSQRAADDLMNDCKQFESPEHINDDPQTAPSKRILQVQPAYQKITDGLQIAQTIGLETMREKCKHFNQWLERLEQLA